MYLNTRDLHTTIGLPRGSGVDDSVLHRFEHDFGADVRAMTQLALWVAEDADAAGVELPDGVRRHITQLQHRGSLLSRFSAKLAAFRQIGMHDTLFTGNWDELCQSEDGGPNVQLRMAQEAIPRIQRADLQLLLRVLADTYQTRAIEVRSGRHEKGVTLSSVSDPTRNLSNQDVVCVSAELGILPHHVMIDGTLNDAILARIADQYAGEYEAADGAASTTVRLPTYP